MSNQPTDALELLGNPQEFDRELTSFRRTARILSSDQPRLIERYPKQWIAAYKGKVRAAGATLESLLAQVEAAGLPRDKIIVRYIDKNQKKMIL